MNSTLGSVPDAQPQNNLQGIQSVSSAANLPVVKLTAEEKHHYSQTYGLPTEGLSPVVQAYIKSGAWKNSSGRTYIMNTEGTTAEQFAQSSYVGTDGYTYSSTVASSLTNGRLSHTKNAAGSVNTHKNLPHSTIQTHAATTAGNTSGFDTAYSDSVLTPSAAAQSETYGTPNNEPLTEPLKESLSRLATIKSHKSQNPELTKLDRINANYEHDKAVLAKNDPLFAKNQFWDVGHADGTEEMTNSEMVKAASRTNNETKINLLGGI